MTVVDTECPQCLGDENHVEMDALGHSYACGLCLGTGWIEVFQNGQG